MFYHFSNVIQNMISLRRNVTQNLGCLTYWLDHWAEAWFSSSLPRMNLQLTLKVMKIKYRKTSWDSGILFFHLIEMLEPRCYQIRLFSLYTLPSVPGTSSAWSQSLYQTFTWDGKSPTLQQTRGLNHLSGNNSPALYLRFSCDPKRVSQISEQLGLVVQSTAIHLQHF